MPPLLQSARAWCGRRVFWLLLGLFLCLRLAQALGAVVPVDDEETINMAAASQLLQHGSWPYQAYQISDWEAGSLVMALLLAGLSLAFGPTLFCLKLAGMAHGALTLGGLWLVCREAGGRTAAALACGAFVAFPGPLLWGTMTAHGFHPDSTGLQLLALWLALRSARPEAGARWALAAGAAGGLAVYFAYISAATLAAASPVLLWSWLKGLPRRASLGRCGALLAGGLLGGAPLLAYNLANGWSGLQLYGDRAATAYLLPGDLAAAWARLSGPVLDLALRMADPLRRDPGVPAGFSAYFWLLALSCLAAPGLHRAHRWMVWLAAVVTAYLFSVSGHELYPWHLYPLVVLLLSAVACALGSLWRGGGALRRGAVALLLAPLVVAGVRANLACTDLSFPGVSRRLVARDLSFFYKRVAAVAARTGDDPLAARAEAHWLALPLEQTGAEPDNLRFGQGALGRQVQWAAFYGDHLFYLVTRDTTPQGVLRFLQEPGPAALRGRRAQLAGYVLAYMWQNPDRVAGRRFGQEELSAVLRQVPASRLGNLAEGMGFGLPGGASGRLPLEGLLRGAAPAADPAPLLSRLYRGQGRALRPPSLVLAGPGFCAAAVPEPHRGAFIEGVGASLGCRMTGPLSDLVDRYLCAPFQGRALQGVARGRFFCARRPEELLSPDRQF